MDQLPRGQAKFIFAITSPKQLEEWLIENQGAKGLAFLGRSNVGKSSLINTLFGKKTAITSKTPGRTRAVNIFVIKDQFDEDIFIFDLPGYGHAEVSKEMAKNWEKLMNLFFSLMPTKVRLINIQDARHPHQKSDQAFYSFLKNFSSETILVLNKIDKLKKQKEKAQLQKVKKMIYEEYKFVREIYFISAEKKDGVDTLEQSILSFFLSP